MLQSTGSQRVGHDLVTEQQQQNHDKHLNIPKTSWGKVYDKEEDGNFF